MRCGRATGSRRTARESAAAARICGDLSVFLTRPISAGLVALAVAALVVAALPTIRRRREVVFADE